MKNTLALILPLLLSSPLQAACEQAQTYYKQAINSHNLQKALGYYQQSAQLCENYAVYYEQGKTLIKLNQFDDALKSFKQALSHSEVNRKHEAKALAQIARVHFQKGNQSQASIYIERAYTISKQRSPQWLMRLRKAIDMENATRITPAKTIKQSIQKSNKTFGVAAKIQLNSITFKFGSTEFTQQGQQQVTELGNALADTLQGSAQALLIGHTDKVGEPAYNITLSERRANAVKQALLRSHQQLKLKLQTEGKGESELKYVGDDEQDHQLNRRVEIEIL